MTRRFFGTDGIRGTVGQSPITPDFMLRLGHAVGRVLKRDARRPTVLIGKDTRISGYMIESALEAGFASAGVDVLLSGPLPTPGVAYLTRALRLPVAVAKDPLTAVVAGCGASLDRLDLLRALHLEARASIRRVEPLAAH